ncbi:MAG TPA: hypothetical protein VMW32_03680 [Bacteroidales bacterium]|nr:hypothetical protein [Bacteroidales bacterium]
MSKINRSVYQKVCEENKRLMKDIRILALAGPLSFEKIECLIKWRKKFARDAETEKLIKAAARQYMKDHPEYDITSDKFNPNPNESRKI